MKNVTVGLPGRPSIWVAGCCALLLLNFVAEAQDPDLDAWIASERTFATNRLLAAISPAGQDKDGRTAAKGCVIASPSKDNPNYFFHWVRDAALVTEVVMNLYGQETDPATKAAHLSRIKDYAGFSIQCQKAPATTQANTGLGEPRYYVDGTLPDVGWGRPQNDGPALRAAKLIRFANQVLDGNDADAKQFIATLYQNTEPVTSLIKLDLEYVGHNWQGKCVDLWEEMNALHFYTRMAQYRSMRLGAAFANRMNDPGAAAFYKPQADQLAGEIAKHWDPKSGYILAMLNAGDDQQRKANELDVAIVLAANHTDDPSDPFFGPGDDRVLATAERLARVFRQLYTINQTRTNAKGRALQPGIGRYLEDSYPGAGPRTRGNPWFLGTAALAELCYRSASNWTTAGSLSISQQNLPFLRAALASQGRNINLTAGETVNKTDARFAQIIGATIELGDGYLRRVQQHADSSGSLSEQFDRNDGSLQSAQDLTWSYAAVLTAFSQRDIALNSARNLQAQPVPANARKPLKSR